LLPKLSDKVASDETARSRHDNTTMALQFESPLS